MRPSAFVCSAPSNGSLVVLTPAALAVLASLGRPPLTVQPADLSRPPVLATCRPGTAGPAARAAHTGELAALGDLPPERVVAHLDVRTRALLAAGGAFAVARTR